jgi:hypothetical protein
MMSATMSAMLSASLSRAAHPYLAVDELSDPLAVALDELSRDQWRSSRAEAVRWRSVEIGGDQWRSSRAEAVRCEPREGERERGREGDRGSSRGTVDLVMMERGG